MRLTQLTMKSFAPFADGEMKFPPVDGDCGLAEVHMFTGENGTGKTRVLAALMAAMGNIEPLQDRVRQDSGAELEVKAIYSSLIDDFGPSKWGYRNGAEDPKMAGFFIETHALAGSGIALLENLALKSEDEVKPARIHEFLSLTGPVGGILRLTEFRKQVAFERDGGGGSPGRLTVCLSKLERAITEITGREFSLSLQPGRNTRLLVKWGEAEKLYFAELPDGLRSLLSWLAGWVVFQAELFDESDSPLSQPVTLFLDEPENHLHPAWQRKVLPTLQRLFPHAQLFVVTHSPFVVSSLNQGWIHKFTRGNDGLVRIAPPQVASRGDSYMTAVQEILDLDEWFDPETEGEIAEFETLLDQAYGGDVTQMEKMRQKAAILKERSEEVLNLISNLEAQFNRTMDARKNPTPENRVFEAQS